MERDLTLVRDILEAVAAHPKPVGWVPLNIPNRTADEISYHVKLMVDADLVEAKDVSTTTLFSWKPQRLTWQGHEFLDAVRNETVWNRVRKVIQDKGGNASFEVVKELAIQISKSYFLGGS